MEASYNDLLQTCFLMIFAGIGFGALLGIICLSVCGVINIFEKSIK